MMNYMIGGMILFSVVSALFTGRMPALSNATMSGCTQAVELAFTLSGTLALWGGVMKIAQCSGVTQGLARLFSPLTRGVLFPRLPGDSPALAAISMNMTANLLGLGNAATPLGIAAMRELEKEAGSPATATRDMVVFVALNTASMQLVPTTTAFLRLQAGSANPMDILVPVWISSLCSVTVAVALAKLLPGVRRYRVVQVGRRPAKIQEG